MSKQLTGEEFYNKVNKLLDNKNLKKFYIAWKMNKLEKHMDKDTSVAYRQTYQQVGVLLKELEKDGILGHNSVIKPVGGVKFDHYTAKLNFDDVCAFSVDLDKLRIVKNINILKKFGVI
ncbi:MAG: hypothetical protein ABF695_12380 [Liquorilactobacillus ghanensis]|uniref:hypothetical protein n=1 Tax=Liquorilactobacillus ghanensis TaxID=399370 RepID=UPI0039E896E0